LIQLSLLLLLHACDIPARCRDSGIGIILNFPAAQRQILPDLISLCPREARRCVCPLEAFASPACSGPQELSKPPLSGPVPVFVRKPTRGAERSSFFTSGQQNTRQRVLYLGYHHQTASSRRRAASACPGGPPPELPPGSTQREHPVARQARAPLQRRFGRARGDAVLGAGPPRHAPGVCGSGLFRARRLSQIRGRLVEAANCKPLAHLRCGAVGARGFLGPHRKPVKGGAGTCVFGAQQDH